MSGCELMIVRNPSRTTGWSSTLRIRMELLMAAPQPGIVTRQRAESAAVTVIPIDSQSFPMMATKVSANSLVLAVWWLTCLIWSSVWLCIKVGVTDVPPATFASVRLVIAVLVLLLVMAVREIPLPRQPRDWAMIGGTGFLLLGLNYAFLYWGAQYISSGLSAVLQAATPAFGLMFAHVLLDDERFTSWQVWGLVLGVLGVGVIFADQLHVTGSTAFWGCLAVTASALCVALGYVVVKKHGSHLRPIELTVGQMMAGLAPLLAIALTFEGNPLTVRWTTPAVASVLYLALAGSVVAFWLNYWLLKRIGATKLLAMSLVEPLIAVILGAVVLHEALPARTLIGGACILASTWVLLSPRSQTS
jgi:drug/metabolite transporter (DMT)-like permease